MPDRVVTTSIWADSWFQKCSPLGQHLFIWAFTNEHCDAPGAYQVGIKTIAFETGITEDKLPSLFAEIKEKVVWYPEKDIVWVKNFLKHNTFGHTYLRRARRKLDQLNKMFPNGLCNEILAWNIKLGIQIPLNPTEPRTIDPVAAENLIDGRWTVAQAKSIAEGNVRATKKDKEVATERLLEQGYKMTHKAGEK